MNDFTLVLKLGGLKHSSSNHQGSLFSNTAVPEHLTIALNKFTRTLKKKTLEKRNVV